MTVAATLDKNKNALLLLTGSNPAINFKEYKNKGLLCNSTDAAKLLFDLVNRKAIHIKATVDNNSLNQDAVSDNNIENKITTQEVIVEKRLRLHYDGTFETLNKRMQKSLDETILFQEEQGLNILYLALGYLSWKEDDKIDKFWRSPLVLIPVKIKCDGSKKLLKNEHWSLIYNEEEIEPNHSLKESLSKTYGINLPEMPDWDTFEQPDTLKIAWEEWISKIKESININKEWQVNDDHVLLSFFSFAKFQMYKDLDSERWCTEENPNGNYLIESLLQNGFQSQPNQYPPETILDHILPAEQPFNVLDLDSSQAEVLLEAKHANCMVVQGPPGTGKSTTITNIIADAINDGKKVLFVAEKMAALQVVKDNLNKVNLGKFCLELHGNKTSKTSFLEDLKNILESRTEATLSIPFNKKTLNDSRNELRHWSDLINTPSSTSEYTPYELFGLILWCNNQSSSDDFPILHNVIDNTIEFQKYATTVTKSSIGYKQIGSNNVFHYGKETEEIKEFQQYLLAIGKPDLHPFYGSELTLIPMDSGLTDIKETAVSCHQPLLELQQIFDSLKPTFPWLNHYSLNEVNKMIQAMSVALSVPNEKVLALVANSWMEDEVIIRNLILSIENAKAIQENKKNLIIDSAWNVEVLNTRTILATVKNNWFNRCFNKTYKSARKQILGYFLNPTQSKEQDLLSITDSILSFQEFKKNLDDDIGLQYFGSLWQGLNSDVTRLNKALDWCLMVQQKINTGQWSKKIIPFLTAQTELNTIQKQYEWLTTANNLFHKHFSLLREKLKLNTIIAEQWKQESFEAIEVRISNIGLHINKLAPWIHFYNKSELFKKTQKNWVLQIAHNWVDASTQILTYFQFKIWEQLLVNASIEHPLLNQMTRQKLDLLQESFRKEDQLLKQYYQLQLINKHNDAVSSFGNIGQFAFIRANLHKKRNIPTVRRFLNEAFDAIASVKPVFMMSPLSVAGYLAAKPEMFDVVIFDEASQIEPVDAFGAILRAKKTIVVGDTKQMPPTSFFKKMTGEGNEIDEQNITADMQSIMELMLARGAQSRSLLWHYRSKHESLISVSNSNFYKNELLVYPSKEKKSDLLGLKFCLLPYKTCYYEGQGINSGEAKVVAQAILSFATDRPEKTLGVVAFNIKQREAIETEVAQLAKDHPLLSIFINKEDKDGKRINFIKNLENVQGDERDVIFISIGYGKTEQGNMEYRFGPLNNDGGERRLNVLITRAREQNVVFCNFNAADLNLSRTESQGLNVLKNFLHYAEFGKENTNEILQLNAASLFEEQVLLAIEKMGFAAIPQVGSKGYKIDIAVIHPEYKEEYVLAIECDGAAYHNAKSARDRDRLRQDILEKGGWRYYRIWSSNWFSNRTQEIQKLLKDCLSSIPQKRPTIDDFIRRTLKIIETSTIGISG